MKVDACTEITCTSRPQDHSLPQTPFPPLVPPRQRGGRRNGRPSRCCSSPRWSAGASGPARWHTHTDLEGAWQGSTVWAIKRIWATKGGKGASNCTHQHSIKYSALYDRIRKARIPSALSMCGHVTYRETGLHKPTIYLIRSYRASDYAVVHCEALLDAPLRRS